MYIRALDYLILALKQPGVIETVRFVTMALGAPDAKAALEFCNSSSNAALSGVATMIFASQTPKEAVAATYLLKKRSDVQSVVDVIEQHNRASFRREH